ncbi:MAG TPA: transcription termination/antitermination NusG family protein [Phycisphaerae bacterium]|nr:transcription termination/antitermination NusG family protein [Phycisphaerae bacterium]
MPTQESNAALDALADLMDLPAERAIPLDLPGHWWVAHTKPRTEKALARELQTMGLTWYLPLRRRETRSRRTGRKSRSIMPVFSSYLFFNATDEEKYRALRTNRIAQVLAPPNQDRLVIELRHIHRVLSANLDYKLHSEIKTGEWVRVTAGPLRGAEGIVSGRLSKARLVLNVGMLGQSISVSVDREDLERIDAPAPRRV